MPPTEPRSEDSDDATLPRRRFLAVGAGVGVATVAGCAGGPTDADGGSTGGTAPSGPAGTFRLLVSDQPSAIGDFDSLVVTLSTARVFGPLEADGEGTDDEADGTATTGTGTGTTAAEPTETTAAPDATTGTPTESDDEDGDNGFTVLDLDGATVDLTTVVGERAASVFEGELAEGRYAKVELHASDVEGVVDGEAADVKLPSEKLQITKSFEVVAGETLSFVFDITVVEKGQGGYNLLPVISESGVAGEDVEVEEVARDGGGSSGATETGGPPATTDGGGGGGYGGSGPPDDG